MKFLKKMEPERKRFSEKDIELAKKALGMKKKSGSKVFKKIRWWKITDYKCKIYSR